MDQPGVSVEPIRFDEYEIGVEEVLEEYHESVALEFQEFLSRLDAEYEFSPETYVDGELKKDLSYLRDTGSKRSLMVALDGDRIAGCVYLYALSTNEGEIKRLYVRKAYRGLGLGRRLIETLIEYAELGGYSTLRLDTAPFMDSALHLYRKFGFEPYDGGESISDIPTPILDDITYMKLRLGDEP